MIGTLNRHFVYYEVIPDILKQQNKTDHLVKAKESFESGEAVELEIAVHLC